MSFKADLRQILKPYYWVNIILSLSYVTSKRTPLICNYLFPNADCELDSRETEILFFLLIIVMLRTRKAGSVTMINYLSSSYVYTKIANLILWFYADVRYGLPFGAILIFCALLLPEPTYSGPEYVTYFRGLTSLDEELKRDKGTTWLVCLYAAWHPACVTFSTVYAELSAKYSLDNLKFAKIDIARYPDAAARYRVQDGPTSRQLPTVLQLEHGAERLRRPDADHTGKLNKFSFSKENFVTAFELDILHKTCKERLAADKNKKTIKAGKAD